MEGLNDALIECVKACGGSKQVGGVLFPEFAPDQAQRKLLDCLNPERPHKLSPEQTLLLLRLARRAGCHVGIEFICADLGYSTPAPIEPRDEVAELQRQVVASLAGLESLTKRMEAAAARVNLKAVA